MPKFLLRILCAYAMLSAIQLRAYAQINANFSASPTSSCGPVTIYFTDLSTGSPNAWEWDFGDNSGKAYNQNPSHTYPANTTGKTYTVTLKAAKGPLSDVETKTAYITIHETPQVNFTATPLTGCAPLKVQFTNTSVAGGNGTNTYSWYFGASGTGNTASPSFTFNNVGPQNVTLTVTNSWGCQASATKNAYVNVVGPPAASFTVNKTAFCSSPADAIFTSTSTGVAPLNYAWDFDDGSSLGSGLSTSHQYTGIPKCWSPKLVVTDGNGCKDSVKKTDFICTYDVKLTANMPAGVCIGIPGTFNATGTPTGGTYSWDWDDGLPFSSGQSASHTFYTATTRTVKVTYTYLGCSASVSRIVTIYPKPTGDFTISPDTLCPAPQTVQFIPSGTFSSYLWDFGDNSPKSSQASPTHPYLANKFYTPTFIFQSSDGCYDTLKKTNYVKLYDLNLDAYAADSSGCVPLTVHFNDSIFATEPEFRRYPYKIASFEWNFGDGIGTSSAQYPTYTYNDTGIFKAVLKITTTKGCTVTDTVKILVGKKPTAYFTVAPTRICNKDFVYFQDSSYSLVNRWYWDFGDYSPPYITQDSSKRSPSHQYMWPGKYPVKLVAYHNLCKSDTFYMKKPGPVYKRDSVIVDSPGVTFTIKYSCDTPRKVNFRNNTVGGHRYKWHFGDGNTDTSSKKGISHIYSSNGIYVVYLEAWNDSTNCHDSMQQTVVLEAPVLSFAANDTAICTGDEVTFTGTKGGIPAIQYLWIIDNQVIGTITNMYTHKFTDKGFHKIGMVTFDQHFCMDTLIKEKYIFVSRPSVQDTATPVTGCAPMTVNFTDLSTVPVGATIVSRKWDFGNGTQTLPGATASRVYGRGKYDVKLIVTDNVGCVDSLTKVEYIKAYKPAVSFTVKDSACIGELVPFANTTSASGNYTSAWDFGDGDNTTADNPQHAYKTLGSFNVRLIVTDAFGCKDTLEKKPAVTTVKPYISFDIITDSVAVCPPLFVKFNNTSTQAKLPYSWIFGDGNTSSTIHANNLFTSPGYFTVMLIGKHNLGCTDTAIRHVNILGYTGSFSYAPLDGCKPLTVTFNATVTNVSSMIWDFSDGYTTKYVGNSVSHTYEHPGAYKPKLLYGDAKGCNALSEGLEEIHVDAVETDFLGDAPCQFSTVTLIDTSKSYFSSKVYWRWTFEDGTTSTQQRPKHYFGSPGTYPIKLYVENSRGCKDSVTKDFVIHPLPDISAGVDTTVCLTDSAHLVATGGVSYKWSYSPTLSCIDCPDPYAAPKASTFYIVTGTDQYNCKNTDTVNVKIKTKVTAIASPDREMCDKEQLQLTVTGARTYLWTPSEGLSDNRSANPVASPNKTTQYTVVSYEGRCIPDTDLVKITVYPLPTVNATGSTTIVAGNSTVIQAAGNLIHRFKWTPTDGLSCSDCPDPTASPLKTTEYKIEVYTDHNCVDSDKVTVEVLCDKSQLFIPNAFTPNGDGQNDVFYPRGTALENLQSFRVYNRWGELVFEKLNMTINDKSAGWDGTFNGNQLPPDVFVYMIEALCTDGKKIMFKGDVTLVR